METFATGQPVQIINEHSVHFGEEGIVWGTEKPALSENISAYRIRLNSGIFLWFRPTEVASIPGTKVDYQPNQTLYVMKDIPDIAVHVKADKNAVFALKGATCQFIKERHSPSGWIDVWFVGNPVYCLPVEYFSATPPADEPSMDAILEQVAEDTGYHNDEFGAAFVDGDYEALRKLYEAAITERDRAEEKLADLACSPSKHSYQDALDEAAASMVESLESDAVPQWTSYFLEAVEDEMNKFGSSADVGAMLRRTMKALEERLEAGRW